MGRVRESTSGFSGARTNKQKPVMRHVGNPSPLDGQRKSSDLFKLAVTDFVVPPRTHSESESEFEFEFEFESQSHYEIFYSRVDGCSCHGGVAQTLIPCHNCAEGTPTQPN
ncbi:hypothetical protein VNO78_28642 [Psophocarpus tetragonolobus]|uniref:Uncharacterized protein n=1 Tax=Psophocarpus tetragonolobus TaxID=3891 RepID=A0AAN9WYJ5_PSOTE